MQELLGKSYRFTRGNPKTTKQCSNNGATFIVSVKYSWFVFFFSLILSYPLQTRTTSSFPRSLFFVPSGVSPTPWEGKWRAMATRSQERLTDLRHFDCCVCYCFWHICVKLYANMDKMSIPVKQKYRKKRRTFFILSDC